MKEEIKEVKEENGHNVYVDAERIKRLMEVPYHTVSKTEDGHVVFEFLP